MESRKNRILILTGSPRKNGNTNRLAAAFAEGAGARHDVEILSVCDYRINPCTGCNGCYTSDGNRCVQNDDMGILLEKLAEADTLIIASPVYFYGISAQLKAAIDRLHTPMRNRFRIRRLGLILVGAAELPDLFDAILAQYRLILRFFRLEDAGTVLVRGAREPGDVGEASLREAFELGRAIRCPEGTGTPAENGDGEG